ncbi:MAG: hypothetical protein [Microviridae sp.]|nr:MAG: hypothetical protein [Microviridae sp.]
MFNLGHFCSLNDCGHCPFGNASCCSISDFSRSLRLAFLSAREDSSSAFLEPFSLSGCSYSRLRPDDLSAMAFSAQSYLLSSSFIEDLIEYCISSRGSLCFSS